MAPATTPPVVPTVCTGVAQAPSTRHAAETKTILVIFILIPPPKTRQYAHKNMATAMGDGSGKEQDAG
jgi:hypothetical protein